MTIRISQFPERSYSLCYIIATSMLILARTKSTLNSLNGVIAYATKELFDLLMSIKRIRLSIP